MRRGALLPLVIAVTASCSWSAFDDYESNTPVTAFSNRGLGARVAIATDAAGNAILGAGGESPIGARFYPLGDGRSEPQGTPLTNDPVCELVPGDIAAGNACLPATALSPAGVLIEKRDGAKDVPHPGCFAIGYGRRSDSSGIDPGPVVYCTDGGLFTLDPAPDSALARAFKNRNETEIRAMRVSIATLPSKGAGENPPLVLGSELDERAWVYPTIEAQFPPVEITDAIDTKGERYGAAVAIARTASTPVFLVSAPGVGKIFGYTLDTSVKPPVASRVACLSGGKGLGEALAVGDVDLDGIDDVLANDAGTVVIYLGRDRPAAPAAGEPCPEWKRSSIVLRCEDVRGVSGCADAGFGSAMAVGDFDKNGKMDVAVGAPYATTDGVSASGAVFLYTPSVGATNQVIDVRYMSQPQTNAAFGAAVASGNVGGQDTLAVGARGKSVSYVVWCTQLEGRADGPRCRK